MEWERIILFLNNIMNKDFWILLVHLVKNYVIWQEVVDNQVKVRFLVLVLTLLLLLSDISTKNKILMKKSLEAWIHKKFIFFKNMIKLLFRSFAVGI